MKLYRSPLNPKEPGLLFETMVDISILKGNFLSFVCQPELITMFTDVHRFAFGNEVGCTKHGPGLPFKIEISTMVSNNNPGSSHFPLIDHVLMR